MADELIVKNTVKALSPRIVAVHGPTGTGKSTVFPLAIAHWAEQREGMRSGLTLCAQPRRILAQQLCERVQLNRKMHRSDKTVGYQIARDSSKNSATKLLYCTEAIVAMMMQQYLVSSNDADVQDVITTVVIDEVHNRSAHSDYVLALTLAAMQRHSFHNERVGRPLVDETCQSSGVNESNKFMVFVPGLAQIYLDGDVDPLTFSWSESS